LLSFFHYLDASKAKNCSAGLSSFGSHLSSHVAAAKESRSGASSRRASNEQLTASTLKSMMMTSSDRNASLDQSRLSQHLTSSLSEKVNGKTSSASQDSLHQINGHTTSSISANGSGGTNTPLTPSSSTSSLNGSRISVNGEKKKKVRGFLKKIFN
jgi:hypothetical protein